MTIPDQAAPGDQQWRVPFIDLNRIALYRKIPISEVTKSLADHEMITIASPEVGLIDPQSLVLFHPGNNGPVGLEDAHI